MNDEPVGSDPSPGPPPGPLLIVLSGPSGVGKDAVLIRLRESDYSLNYITTLTTRPRRDGEQDQVDYQFVTRQKYQEMLDAGELLESAEVYGNWYGVPRTAVKQSLDRGEDTVIKVDVQGAATIRKTVPQAVFIFLVAPSTRELARRLERRLTESPADLALRLRTAEEEMKELPLFDYVVVNRSGEVGRAVHTIEAIIAAEKCRVNPRRVVLP